MFEIRVQEGDRIEVSGRLDASQAPRAEAVLGKITRSCVADLGALDYISSAGLGALVKTHLRLQQSGQALRLVNLTPRVRAVFHYAGLEQTFGIE